MSRQREPSIGQVIKLPVRSITSIMRELGDPIVDILKIDIEGAEVEVVPSLLETWSEWPKARWPKVLLIDMDSLRVDHPRRNVSGARMVVPRSAKKLGSILL